MTTLAQLKRKTKAELQHELEARGLETTGTKDDLVSRLKDAIDTEIGANPAENPTGRELSLGPLAFPPGRRIGLSTPHVGSKPPLFV